MAGDKRPGATKARDVEAGSFVSTDQYHQRQGMVVIQGSEVDQRQGSGKGQDFSQQAQPPDIFSAAFDPFSGFTDNANTGTMAPTSPEVPSLVFCGTPSSTNLSSNSSSELSGGYVLDELPAFYSKLPTPVLPALKPTTNCLGQIRDYVISMMPTAWTEGYKASLRLDWDLVGFLRSQFVENDKVDLSSVIVVSGSVLCAHATTCSEYVDTRWPSHGSKLILLLQQAVTHESHEAEGIRARLRSSSKTSLDARRMLNIHRIFYQLSA